MEYKLGNSKNIYSHGQTTEITCPHCKEKVEFSVFTNFETRAIAKLPLIKTNNIYFLVCPNCAKVYTVDEAQGKAFRKDSKFAILTGDLKELEKFDV
jgi:transcription elongation factor Elf1